MSAVPRSKVPRQAGAGRRPGRIEGAEISHIKGETVRKRKVRSSKARIQLCNEANAPKSRTLSHFCFLKIVRSSQKSVLFQMNIAGEGCV